MKHFKLVPAAAFLAVALLGASAANGAPYFADPNPASLGSVSVSADRVSVGGTVTVAYDVTDPDGVASVSPEVIDCDPATAGADSAPTGYQSSADTAKSFGITYDSTSRPGRRWLAALTVRDRAGYVTTFYDESYARAKGLTGVPTADFSKVTWEIVSPDQAPVYKELDTASHVYFRGSGTGLRFRFDGPFEQFSYLAVDGAAVDPSNYSVKSGSTIIELSPAYLAALPTGSHDLKVLYRDGGTATTSFAISGKPESSNEQDAGKGNVKPSERASVLENGPALARTGDCTGFTIVSMLITAAALLAASALLKKHFGA